MPGCCVIQTKYEVSCPCKKPFLQKIQRGGRAFPLSKREMFARASWCDCPARAPTPWAARSGRTQLAPPRVGPWPHHAPFLRRLPLNVQLPAITLILFALCVGIFCYLAQWMSYEEVDQSALIHLGANVASLTLSDESWRLLSSVFLHSSFSHLLMNMFALPWWWGQWRNGYWGKWRLLDYLLFSGIFGGLISACCVTRK